MIKPELFVNISAVLELQKLDNEARSILLAELQRQLDIGFNRGYYARCDKEDAR